MKPVEFEGQTALLGPPREAQRGTCGALPVRREEHPHWGMCYVSYWRPTKEELEILNAGGHVRLMVGGSHPPVWLDADRVVELP